MRIPGKYTHGREIVETSNDNKGHVDPFGCE